MKNKALSFLASIFLLSFASCTDEVQEMANEQSQTLKQIVMTTQDFQPEAGSRTIYEIEEVIKCTWADNDTVGIFPDKGAQAYFPMASGAGTKNATFDGEGWALKDGRTYGAYYPCIGKFYLDRNAVPVSYTGQIQAGNASMEHLGAYDYMVATPTVPEAGLAQFTFKHLSALVLMKITIPQPATLTSVKLVTDTKAFAVEGTVNIMAETLSITPVVSSKEFILDLQDIATTEANQVVTLYMMIPPTDLSEQTLKAVIMSDKGTQEIAFAGKNFKAGTAYTLSGKLESTDLGYKDGVVRMAEAGTMKQFLGDDWLNITSLKVVGPINGDDVLCLRQMLGASEFSDADKGKLASLDLSDAMIVEGGSYYYCYEFDSSYHYTSNDVIGKYMFTRCTNLQNIVLPIGITTIGYSAFDRCSSLTTIYILDSVTTIGNYAFYDCGSLTSIDIPDEVTSIGSGAFDGCSSLNSIHIQDLSAWCNITFSDYSSNPLVQGAKLYLNNNELTELVIPADIKQIKDYAFSDYSSLTSIQIPDGVTSIGNGAFASCSSLNSIHIPNGVTSIGSEAFKNCSSLTSINIPNSVTSIGQYAFSDCSSLTSIDIPDSVTSIGTATFNGCSSLTSITMGDNVTSIGSAFSDCYSLKSVHIKDLSSWCKITFSTSSSNPLVQGVKLYLNNNELTELVIPTDIKQIKNYAFYNYKSIKKLTIGEQVTSIGIQSFRGCSSLTQVYCQGTTPPTINASSANSSFNGSSASRTLYVPAGCSSAYQSSNWASFFGTIEEME